MRRLMGRCGCSPPSRDVLFRAEPGIARSSRFPASVTSTRRRSTGLGLGNHPFLSIPHTHSIAVCQRRRLERSISQPDEGIDGPFWGSPTRTTPTQVCVSLSCCPNYLPRYTLGPSSDGRNKRDLSSTGNARHVLISGTGISQRPIFFSSHGFVCNCGLGPEGDTEPCARRGRGSVAHHRCPYSRCVIRTWYALSRPPMLSRYMDDEKTKCTPKIRFHAAVQISTPTVPHGLLLLRRRKSGDAGFTLISQRIPQLALLSAQN